VPELPEVEVLRRSLAPRLVGRAIERITSRRVALREPLAGALLRRSLCGREILAVERRAKYLLLHCAGGQTLVIHLGMSGRLTLAPQDAPRESHEHLALFLSGGERLRLRDPRRFGLAFVTATADLARDPHFALLGIEPLAGGFDGSTLERAARGRRGPLKAFLLDGRTVVGVGNIYACEALFRAGLHPARSVAKVKGAAWQRLAQAVVAVLEQAIEEGGTTLNDFTDGAGREGSFQVSLAAYGRAGEPCVACGARVRRIVQSGRSTFYCPRCQR